jgi:amidohydrolase
VKALATGKEGVDAGAVRLRREIHALPETAFEEVETAGLVAARMMARGLKVRTGVGKTGVSALYDSGRPGKTVLLRADLDALPLTEKTGLPFAATNGKMHACGHDGHVAALDAAADLLLLDPPARGRVVFAFQPGEEGAGGAMMAAVDEFSIEVTSPGGHAASPHETRDTIVAAAHVVTALQTIVSRRISSLLPTVVSVTSVHGGSAFNILPESVTLRGTCRSFDVEVADLLPSLVGEIAERAAQTLGCAAKMSYRKINPAVVNHPAEAERVLRTARSLTPVAAPGGVTADVRTMGGEDFSEFLLRVPGAFAFVGAARSGAPRRPHHAPDFDFDERALPNAARLLAGFARDVLAG